jgi:hypothetical protein
MIHRGFHKGAWDIEIIKKLFRNIAVMKIWQSKSHTKYTSTTTNVI